MYDQDLEYNIPSEVSGSRNIRKVFSGFGSLLQETLDKFIKYQNNLETKLDNSNNSFINKFDLFFNSFKQDGIKISNIEDFKKTEVTGEVVARVDFPEEQKISGKVDIDFPEEQKISGKVDAIVKFPEIQKVMLVDKIDPPIIKVIDKIIKFPAIQDIKGKVEIDFPDKQEVFGKVDLVNKEFNVNLSDEQIEKIAVKDVNANVKFPDIQKVEVSNPIKEVSISNLDKFKLDIPSEYSISNLPTARGNKLSKKADPGYYVPVRLTDGQRWIDSFGGNSVVMGNSGGSSSMNEDWVTTSGAVLSTSTLLLPANQLRKAANFTNDGPDIVYLSFGQEAKVGAGIRLNDYGGSYEINKNNMFKGNVFAISDGTISNICILEVKKNF